MSAADDESASKPALAAWALLIAISFSFGVLPRVLRSLTAPELETCWLVKDGRSSLEERARDVGRSGSRLPLALTEAFVRAAGTSEGTLRFPSLVATLAGLVLVYRLGKRLRDADTGLAAALLLVASPAVAEATASAGAETLAIPAAAASTLALLAWRDSGRAWLAPVYVLVTSFAVSCGGISWLLVAVHSTHALAIAREKPGLATMLAIASGVSLGVALPFSESFGWDRGRAENVTCLDLAHALVPPSIVVPAVVGVLLTRAIAGAPPHTPEVPPRATTWLLLCWYSMPLVVAFLLSLATGEDVMPPRSALFAAPALALVGAWVLGFIRPPSARLAAGALVVAAQLAGAGESRAPEDLRGALALASTASPETPVLMRAPSVCLRSGASDGRALASLYRIGGRLELLPAKLDASCVAALEGVVRSRTALARGFVLVEYQDGLAYDWLKGRLVASAWASQSKWFGAVRVTVFAPARPRR